MQAVLEAFAAAPPVPVQVLSKFTRDYGVDMAEAARQFEELRKFLAVCAADRGNAHAPSAVIDHAWHTFVLHTQDYAGYCDINLGGFVHHRPSDRPESESYAYTRQLLEQAFGAVDPTYWPVGKAGDCKDSGGGGGGSCGEGACDDPTTPKPGN